MGVDRVAKARRLALQAVLNLDVHLAVGVIFDIENRADGEGVARRAVVPKICSYLDHTGTCGLADDRPVCSAMIRRVILLIRASWFCRNATGFGQLFDFQRLRCVC